MIKVPTSWPPPDGSLFRKPADLRCIRCGGDPVAVKRTRYVNRKGVAGEHWQCYCADHRTADMEDVEP